MPFTPMLDLATGVPAYRQIIDQVLGAIASGTLQGGDQLPTVRQLAVDLSINPNTVVRAYRELEIRGILTTQQGIGTFVTTQPVPIDEAVRQRQLDHLIGDLLARAGAAGLSADEVVARLQEFINEQRGMLMMPSLNVFRQATAEADVRSEMSNVGIALLVFGVIAAAWLWQLFGPAMVRWHCRSSPASTAPTP